MLWVRMKLVRDMKNDLGGNLDRNFSRLCDPEYKGMLVYKEVTLMVLSKVIAPTPLSFPQIINLLKIV